ncbi:tyrosyl-DNA phosphodiesterase 2-like isoform X1 [Amblyomma americanum]
MEDGDGLEIIELPQGKPVCSGGDVHVLEVHDSDSDSSFSAHDSTAIADDSCIICDDSSVEIVDSDLECTECAADAQETRRLSGIVKSMRRVSMPSSDPAEVPTEVRMHEPQKRREVMTLVSWNVDGLNKNYLHQRISAVCSLTLRLDPDVVFFQEVIPEVEAEIRNHFLHYLYIPGDSQGYYVATLLKKDSVRCNSHSVAQLNSSKMERHIVLAETTFSNKDVVLLNTHLESMNYSTEVRKVQLRRCFRQCKKEAPDKTVIFGGDLNLRDHEVDASGGLPPGVEDVWEACGSDPSLCYTWDMACNDNLDFGGRSKARLRFDRVYIRHSQPATFVPASFRLIGQKRLQVERCFPSDHWGLAIQFRCL